MALYFIIILGLVVLGCGIMYLILLPRLREIDQHNEEELQRYNELRARSHQLEGACDVLQVKREELLNSIDHFTEHLQQLQMQADEAARIFYERSMNVAQEQFALAAEQARQDYLNTIADYETQLAIAMEEGVSEFLENTTVLDNRYKQLQARINQLQTTTDAAVAAAKRAEEIKAEADYYKLQLSDLDLEEIRILRNITPYLRDKEPLNKVIWKVYYEKPTTDLIGRVIGSGVHTGIYKITNLDNQKCYVGQAANLADRWKQHIKRGIGAETPTKNKLYPAMIAFGVENFSFEVIEECPREKLDEREDYWQEYFKAKEFGYSIK